MAEAAMCGRTNGGKTRGRAKAKPRGGVLRSLGFFGLDGIETSILAGLVTGDPVLLIGSHGSAKTLLAHRLAEALGLRFHAYDASKAMFEDVIGFPNPESLCKGVIEYTPTPISIWGKQFVLVDELSRSSPAMQNKWLEVIRSRQIMGKKVEGLRFIFAAMNPPGYLGSMPLDEALAGRFALVIKVPEARDMTPENIGKIIWHISEDDAPALIAGSREQGAGATKQGAGGATNFESLVRGARERFAALEKEFGETLRNYTTHLAAAFKLNRHPLDGRRLGMIYRNLIAYLAVHMEKNRLSGIEPEALDNLCYSCLGFSLPFEATGMILSEQVRFTAHRTAIRIIWEEKTGLSERLKLFLAGGPLDMAREYRKSGDKITENEHQDFVSHLEELLAISENPSDVAQAFLALEKVARAYQGGTIKVDPDTMRRAMQVYLQLTSLWMEPRISELISHQNLYGIPAKIDLNDRVDNLALRLTINLTGEGNGRAQKRRSRRSSNGDEIKEASAFFQSLRFELRRHEDEDNRIKTA